LLESLPYSFERSQISAARLLPPDNIAAFIANAIIHTALAYRDPQFVIMVPARLQLALYLDPQNDAARFFLAQSWFELGQFDRARTALLAIDDASLWALPRMLLHNDIDIRTDNLEAAIERFDTHVIRRPKNAYLYKELGDLYRRHEHYEQARDNYLQAKNGGFDTAILYRNLAIAHERLDEDAQAEVGFKAALQRNPNDPFTLNYLGYWWAESGRHLDQAIQLIEQAVRLRPNSGFFVDSLGWVHYQLGNYQLAVEFLEKATMLEPEDALIISHLGDAYWQTERYAEAQFKWRYAAQLADDEDLQAELQTKLASGLAATEQ
jgi:Flp pilus assembly protein TadD